MISIFCFRRHRVRENAGIFRHPPMKLERHSQVAVLLFAVVNGLQEKPWNEGKWEQPGPQFFFIQVSIFEKVLLRFDKSTSTALYLSISILPKSFFIIHRSIKSTKGSVDRTGTGTTKQQELTRPSTIVTHAHLRKEQHILDENNCLQILYGYRLPYCQESNRSCCEGHLILIS